MSMTIVDDFREGDFVQVNGDTFFSGRPAPEFNTLPMSYYTPMFGRVGVVKDAVIHSNGYMTVTVNFWQTGEVANFAAYQLKKLDKISPYL